MNDSSADEDNAKVRTIADLRAPEQRALSADPARAHRQLINAMKEQGPNYTLTISHTQVR